MKTIHVILNTRGLSVAQYAVYGQSIATALNKNSNFENLYPTQATLQGAVDGLNAAIAAAKPGDKESTAALHAAEVALGRILKALVAHVEYESNNDEAVALSSGFSLRQPTTHSAHGFEASYGLHSGTVDLRSPYQSGSSYVWQFTADTLDAANWQISAITTQARHLVKGLKVGTNYWFRVALVTSNGQQPFSDPIMLLVI